MNYRAIHNLLVVLSTVATGALIYGLIIAMTNPAGIVIVAASIVVILTVVKSLTRI